MTNQPVNEADGLATPGRMLFAFISFLFAASLQPLLLLVRESGIVDDSAMLGPGIAFQTLLLVALQPGFYSGTMMALGLWGSDMLRIEMDYRRGVAGGSVLGAIAGFAAVSFTIDTTGILSRHPMLGRDQAILCSLLGALVAPILVHRRNATRQGD